MKIVEHRGAKKILNLDGNSSLALFRRDQFVGAEIDIHIYAAELHNEGIGSNCPAISNQALSDCFVEYVACRHHQTLGSLPSRGRNCSTLLQSILHKNRAHFAAKGLLLFRWRICAYATTPQRL